MESVGANGLGLRDEKDFIHFLDDLPRPALLGDAIQRDTLRNLQVVELPNQREGGGIAGFEVDEEEGLPR